MPFHQPWAHIKQVIQEGNHALLRQMLDGWLVDDLADLMTSLKTLDQAAVLRSLPQELAAETFKHLWPGTQERLLKALSQEEIVFILNRNST